MGKGGGGELQETEHHLQNKPTDLSSTFLTGLKAGGTECINACRWGKRKGSELETSSTKNCVSGKVIYDQNMVRRNKRKFQKK